MTQPSRRDLFLTAAAVGSAVALPQAQAASKSEFAKRFRYCLNTSTIRGQKLTLKQEIEVAAKAGYDGIEPWIRHMLQHEQSGGKLEDLAKMLKDNGMTVESAIGFARWIVDDDAARAKGLEDMKRDMDLVARLGGTRIAAPASGATRKAVDLRKAGERYRTLLELGDKMGVVPQIEVWGGTATLGRLSQAIFVAIEAGHPSACLLGDVYHFYKGGSSLEALRLLGPHSLQAFHMNDYPADPPQDKIRDEHRVYPGQGIADLKNLFAIFHAVGAAPALSLELFNREYWKQDPLKVAQVGLKSMKDAVAAAFS